jgi:ABC-2 type transport system permease protein
MLANPLTYGVAALRGALDPDSLRNGLGPAAHALHSLPINLAVTVGFCLLTFATSWAVVNRRTRKPAA